MTTILDEDEEDEEILKFRKNASRGGGSPCISLKFI